VFERNLQRQPVREVSTPRACHRSRTWQRFKRSKGVKPRMAFLECKILLKNGHRTSAPVAHTLGNSSRTVRRPQSWPEMQG
jgi:hypothetical protein